MTRFTKKVSVVEKHNWYTHFDVMVIKRKTVVDIIDADRDNEGDVDKLPLP